MASPGPEFVQFLVGIHLDAYKEFFSALRVEKVEDLQDVDEEELKNMGMNSTEIRRFIRKVNQELKLESSTALSFTPVPITPEISNQIIARQTIRTNLRISYKLMTELQPQVKHLSTPINGETVHYFDLVNIICEQERTILGNDLTIELYTCEGYPLATNPSCYVSKLSDWCLETYNPVLLYAIPRRRVLSIADEGYSANVKRLTGNEEIIFIRNINVGFGPIPVGLSCKEVTVKKVKEYMYCMTSLPPSCFKLQLRDVKLENEKRTLKDYEIKDQSVIEILPDSELWLSSWDQNFSAGACLARWSRSQSRYGISMFYSSLYAFSEWIKRQPENICKNVLGHIRSITGCPPLIHSLRILFNKECLCVPHRVAIQEIFMLLFLIIGPKQLKGESRSFVTIQENTILEETNKFLAYFIDNARDYHGRTEEFLPFKLCCSVKKHRMIEPKRVIDSQGIPHIVDKQNYTGQIDNEMFGPLPEHVRLIKAFSGFEAQVWNVREMMVNKVDLTREWNQIISNLIKRPFLCIQLPLGVKDITCPVPCMTLRDNGMVCNYIGPSKGDNIPYEGFDPLGGDTFNFDADDLDEKLRNGNFPQFVKLLQRRNTSVSNPTVDFSTITRPMNELEEIIMVVLDTSGSMDSIYFSNKTKYELAMTGFEQFCNRTTAYNFKNMIGLVLFGGDSKLQLPLTESFRHFSNQITSFPEKGSTAIYDAIRFAIRYLNSFKSNHGMPNTMSTRILCITDGGDNASRTTPDRTSFSLLSNNIVMDSILLCEGRVLTHAIAKVSGGYSFQPKDQKELLRIFENETMLNLACRRYKNHLENNLDEALLIPHDTDTEFLYPDKLTSTFETSEKCLANAVLDKIVTSQVSPEVTKRILRELAYLQTDPHPFFEVFPCSDAVDLWHLMLEAPISTHYKGGVFRLYVEFTRDYPNKAPNIRFITPIYHCNINSAGRICHKILDRFYSSEKKIRELLDHVYGLLLEATPDDPLDSYKATLLRTNKRKYDKEVREFTALHARNKTKRDVRIGILGGDPDIRSRYNKQFVCPLTLSLFKNPVVTCYGETYEEEAIIDYIDNVAEQDPYSFKSLRKDQLFPNNTIKEGVREFRSKLQNL